ncbi:cellulose binding domain-containing protein [Streptosporangium longisporum]|uniref:CBM2 domain-containing protein n=1 Tax=Streptosporangium longisporum TaxID=46187 RepID=A0ABP6KFB2_9ACTN
MPPTMRITSLLGLLSLTAAAILPVAACAGRTAEGGHAGTHPPAGSAQNTAPQNAALATPSGAVPAPPPSPSSASSAAPSSPSSSPSSSSTGGTPHPQITSAAECRATVTLVETWPGGYRGAATIKNNGDLPLGGWYIQWMMPHGVTITQAWKGTHMQSGPVAMIHAPAEDPPLQPGKKISEIGFIGTAATPPAFTDITCG